MNMFNVDIELRSSHKKTNSFVAIELDVVDF